ncbi:hypothetical protein [[Kitasatospora] papulosa]|uniref:hypothetical protein n=1 Tax=[Kitasatospora] papulosa TaxID=1464011 RepID=UPI0036BF7578
MAYGDPGDAHVLHCCNGGSGLSGCINIRHLYLGTEAENKRDMVHAGRTLRGLANNPGEVHGTAKLTEQQVLDIRRDYVRGRPHRAGNKVALAQEYRVSHQTITSIVTRMTWKHI